MTEQHQRGAHSLNASFVSFILIINFVVIAGIIGATTPLPSPQTSREAEVAAAVLVTPSIAPPTLTLESVPTLTATLLPPTEAPTVEESAGTGDFANGQVLFNTFQPAASFACATCHYVDREDQLIGPGLLNVSIRAESRVPGISIYDYLHMSIVNPGAFVVPGFPDGLMPRNWAEVYSESEINDLIAYLMTLR
ncbi:MAG: cytochrome c [Anaerolineae bacterium]|nr:cytochrome c [Anaerolineae bacterium]NUQ03314.1 cytochrome c [Anaerolineae bacterium]